MIITRSPLRITLGGGGTDLPSYYREHGGFLIAAAIDKYVYVTVIRPFVAGHLPQVLQAGARRAGRRDRSTRSSARRCGMLEITDAAARDHHAGRHSGRHRPRLVGQLHHGAAEGAVHARAPLLRPASWPSTPARSRSTGSSEPIGKQDQYIAAYGGITCFTFDPDDRSTPRRCRSRRTTLLRPRGQPAAVLHRLLAQRRARSCKDQDQRTKQADDGDAREPALRQGARPAQPAGARAGDPRGFGELMHEHWEHKSGARAA